MAENNSDLIEYLDEKFSGIDTRIDALDEKFTRKFDDLLGAVDAYAQKADTYFQEMAALGAKVNRLEKNLQKIAEKIGIKLD